MRKLIGLVLALAAMSALAQGDASSEAFSQAIPGLSDAERETFFRGRTLVRQSWVSAPSKDDQFDGLGPLYNRLACISCHPRNGRGRPPEAADERMLSMLVRLSVPGKDPHGGPKPHPAYGGQLNEEGIPGVPGEGRAILSWREVARVTLAGGEKVSLREPTLKFSELNYGPISGVLSSLRVGEQMVGMGYLDAVPAEALEAMAKEVKPDGVKGRVNRVWNPETRRMEVGRFGYKSNMPTLRAQSAGAFYGDLGITSPLFPDENCTSVQKACQKAPNGGSPELTAQQLDEVEFYLAHLIVPPRRDTESAKVPPSASNQSGVPSDEADYRRRVVSRGGTAFAQAGCTACHRPELKTDPNWRFPRLAGQTIRPYTDLLVHDMGRALSDRRPDGLANGREWRTPPLWGIGLTQSVSESGFYLHDGRARSLVEAIVWHGGEAKPARDRFVRMNKEERDALVAFLESL